MSLRTSRRSQAAAASAAGEEIPSVPISEIRARKWTKQVKNVGHITIVKWVPEQEHPTEALQRGGFKKTKGRKRPMAEVGRMTRSVRQHLDAPLELLVEMPAVRQSTRATASHGIVPTPHSAPVAAATPPATTAPTADGSAAAAAAAPGAAATATSVPPAAMPSVASAESLLGMSGDSMMFSEGVASEEQLERELDDLPFLDSDNLAMDPALAMDRHDTPTQPPAAVPAAVAAAPSARQPVAPSAVPEPTAASSAPAAPVAQPSPDASASAASAEDDGASSSPSSSDDDDDDDDGNETASVDSATPQQSPSPTMMSRSPSP